MYGKVALLSITITNRSCSYTCRDPAVDTVDR